ncbi:MAG TPA: hypothetical protein VLA92_04785, partial [Candidatus Saccharimonadales bacterium]|nr:hypothetical protein [Candidatus Saccharimonadales bacterium]
IPRTNTKLATGYIRGVQIEAVTPQDLPDGMFERATFRYPEAREHDNNALLVESAELVLGRAVYRVASLTVVANDEKRPYNYRLHAASFGHNEIQKAAALWESGVPAREIGSWGLMRTVELSEE